MNIFFTSYPMASSIAEIPLIDIHSADEQTIARQLVDGAEKHGFIYIRNLGKDISANEIDTAFGLVSLPCLP